MIRVKLSNLFFGISSLFKALGTLIRTKDKTVLVAILPLPGWFILDECIIHQTPLESKKLIGFDWHYWPMPNDWIKEMQELKKSQVEKGINRNGF